MKPRSSLLTVIAAAALAAVAAHSISQQPPANQPPQPPQPPGAPAPASTPSAPAAPTPAGAPDAPAAPAPRPDMPSLEQITQRLAEDSATAPEHKVLADLAGAFKTESRMFIDPEHALTSHGTTKGAWILGDRFMKVESTIGNEKELKGEALTIYGFDTRTRKYTVLALDTFGTYWVSAEGDYDKDARELRLTGSITEAGETTRFRWTVKFTDKGHTQTVLLNVQGEVWMKVAETMQSRE